MYKILKAEKLAANIYLMDVEAPRVARHCEPGQFVIVKMDEKGERIPLTICDYDREAGTITIVFQPVGASTTKMTEMKAGDYFRDFTGPLGCPSEFIHEDLEENLICRWWCRSRTGIPTGKMDERAWNRCGCYHRLQDKRPLNSGRPDGGSCRKLLSMYR